MRNCESVQMADGDLPISAPVSPKVTIALIDRRALDRECLARGLLASQPHLEVQLSGSVEEWTRKGHDDASAVLLGIGSQTAGDPAVEAALGQLRRDFPSLPVIILADSESARDVLMALDRGACGYIPSSVGLRVLVEVVNLVRAGGIYVPASSLTASRLEILAPDAEVGGDPFDGLLTPRQAAVAEALRQGKANKIIAYELDLSESTVKVHIRAIMRKLQAHNRTEVAFKISGLGPFSRPTARLVDLPPHRETLPNVGLSRTSEPALTAVKVAAYG